MSEYETSELVQRGLPCDDCGSSDAVALYSDEHTHCFSCGKTKLGQDGVVSTGKKKTAKDFKPYGGDIVALKARGITEETVKKYGYRIGEAWHPSNERLEKAHICPVKTETGEYVGQKCRFRDKEFSVNGTLPKGVLIGMHLFSGGKRLIITEGEIDMLSVSQAHGNKYPAVSIPNGVKSAKRTLTSCIQYLQKYDEVVLAFDMDDKGQEAAKEVAEALAGTVTIKIAKYELKDANEMLLAGKSSELVKSIWNASEYRPDSLLEVGDVLETLFDDEEAGLPWKHQGMNESSNGRFFGEVHTIGAGTGLGKTTILLEQADYDVTVLKQKVGLFLVENDPKEVLRSVCGKHDGRLYHVRNTDDWNAREDIKRTAELYKGQMFIYDNWGLCEWESIKAKILYLITLGYRIFYIDHLTALATGSSSKDEKAEIECIMADVASLAQRHEILIHLVSHLSTPEKGSHEEGARVSIKNFKGSRAIGFWSHAMYGMERNQQADSVDERLITTVRQLKRRGFGSGVGRITKLRYSVDEDRSYELSQGESIESPFESREVF